MKSGFVAIVGRPNVGKSTLINKLVNYKVAITSDKAGTTRNNIFGIYNDFDSQIIFVDTPGIGRTITKLDDVLNKKAYTAADNDLVLFVVDIASGFGPNDKKILSRIAEDSSNIILVLSKVDKIKKEELISKIDEVKDIYDFKEIVPVSSIKNVNINELVKTIKKYLPEEDRFYAEDEITNVSEKFMVGELIREKVLNLTQKEVPYSVTCLVESMKYKKDSCYINALLVVDRDNLKGIIIGKNGQMLKEIGSRARYDIEKLLGKRVYLELFVKTIDNWRDKESSLIDLGITNDD